eukprot:16597_1
MELKRNVDPIKNQILQQSIKVRPLLPNFEQRIKKSGHKVDDKPHSLPSNIRPNVHTDIYTTIDAYEVLQGIQLVVKESIQGVMANPNCNQIFDDNLNIQQQPQQQQQQNDHHVIDIDNFCLSFTVAMFDKQVIGVTVHVQLYFDTKYECNLVQFNVVKGEKKNFIKLRKVFLDKAASVLTGLPKEKAQKPDEQIMKLYKECFP